MGAKRRVERNGDLGARITEQELLLSEKWREAKKGAF